MLKSIGVTILRSVFAYLALLLLTRMMGRKVISQMSFFNFIAGITIGTITAEIAMDTKGNSVVPVTAMLVLVALTILIEAMDIKSFKLRRLVNSTPQIVIENGSIVDKNLKKSRLTLDELMMHLREKDIFNVADVEFAVLEIDGQLSVLPKSQKQPLTPADLKISTKYVGLTKDLIIDGKIFDDSLKEIGLGESWLMEQLAKQGIKNASEVFYAGLDTEGSLYVSKRSPASK